MESAESPSALGDVGLVELVNRILDRGVVLSGEVVVSVADIDLLYLNLNVLLGSVESIRPGGHARPDPDVGGRADVRRPHGNGPDGPARPHGDDGERG